MLSVPKQELNGQFAMLPMDDVHFGAGSVNKLGAALEQYGIERAVIITGHRFAQQTDLVDRVAVAAGGRVAGVCRASRPDVTREGERIEEVGSHNGDDRLPAALPMVRSIEEPATPEVLGESLLKKCFVAAGCYEAMSSSLSSTAEQAVFVDQTDARIKGTTIFAKIPAGSGGRPPELRQAKVAEEIDFFTAGYFVAG